AFSRVLSQLSERSRSALPMLATLRTNENSMIRVEATYAIWRIDPSDTNCGTELLKEFIRGGDKGSYRAGEHLAKSADSMMLAARETVPVMVTALREGHQYRATQAAQILTHFHAEAIPALPELTKALADPDYG